MTRVLVLGHPFTAARIARHLSSRLPELQATYIPHRSYLRLLASPPRSGRVVLMRAGYRVGATTPRGRLFDAYWSQLRRTLPKAARCHYWLGTDVLETIKEIQAGTIRTDAVLTAQDDLHLSVAPWLTSELGSVGISATTALLPPPNRAPPIAPPLPAEFSVLTYLPGARFGFYGGDAILAAARRMPEVRFDVVGDRGEANRATPLNVHYHGWVADLSQRYANTAVVVRIPDHDGFGNTVIEGLLHARHVVYTYEVPFAHRVWPATAETLVTALTELREAHVAGRLQPNLDGRKYALDEFDEDKLMDRLTALMRALA